MTEDDNARASRPQRQHDRTPMEVQVQLRRNSHSSFRVPVLDASPEGCRLEFVERPRVDDLVWVRFDGLETLEGMVCWVDGHIAGIQYTRPIHPAVFQSLLTRLGGTSTPEA